MKINVFHLDRSENTVFEGNEKGPEFSGLWK